MLALLAVTEAMNLGGSATLAAFVYSQGDAAAYQPVFSWALPICLAVFAVSACIALRKGKEWQAGRGLASLAQPLSTTLTACGRCSASQGNETVEQLAGRCSLSIM